VEKEGAAAWVILGRGSDLRRALEIRATSEANDIAVLSVDRKLSKPSVKLVHRQDVKQGEDAVVVGFPQTTDQWDEDMFNAPPTPTPGKVVQNFRLGGTTHFFQLTADINPGNSGGPVFNSRGHVIGMATLKGRSSSLNYAVDADEVLEVIKRTPAIAEIAAGGTQVKPGPEAVDPAVAQQEKDRLAKEQQEREKQLKEQQDKEQQNKMLMYGGAAVGVILLVVVIVMATRKKPGQAPMQGPMPGQMPPGQMPGQIPGAAPMPPTAAAPQTRPVSKRSMISGISGFFAGKSMEIPAGRQMMFGRDPQQAQLVFPSDMNEISRIHCVVSFDAGSQSFVVEDRSTNGTFLVSGQRISGQARLKSGERFYLSEPNNMFEVRAD